MSDFEEGRPLPEPPEPSVLFSDELRGVVPAPAPTTSQTSPPVVREPLPTPEPPEPPAPPVQAPASPRARAWELATWGSRVMAAVIDAAAISVAAGVVVALVELAGLPDIAETVVEIVAVTAVWLSYAPILLIRNAGCTWGKQVMGIRVVRAGGEPIDASWAVYREVVVKIVAASFAAAVSGGLSVLADALWPLFDKQRRALHDLMAESRVVKGEAPVG